MQADSVYSRMSPWQSLPERIVTDSLGVAEVPGDVLALQSPPSPVVRPLFPPRFGYRTTALGIEDALMVNQLFPAPINRAGGSGEYSGSPRLTLGGS